MKPFRIAAFADEADAQIDGQIQAMRKNHVELLEVRNVDGTNVSKISLEKAKEVRKKLEANGLGVWSIGSPIGKIKITDPFAPHLDEFKHTLEIAHTMGATCIRLFSFYADGDWTQAKRDTVMEQLTKFTDAAAGSSVLLCHENEKGIYGDIAPRCLDILKSVPKLKAIFDPANFIQCGQPTLPAWEMLAPYVYYCHIKDARADGTVVPAGKGEGHLPEILSAFAKQGGGTLTLEPHLKVFSGLDSLENGEKSVVTDAYPSNEAAFAAACSALYEILPNA